MGWLRSHRQVARGWCVSRRHRTNLTKKQELLERISLIQHNSGRPNLQVEEWIRPTHLSVSVPGRGESELKTTENESRADEPSVTLSSEGHSVGYRRDSPPALSPEQLRVHSRLPTSVASSAPPGLPSSAFLDSCGKKRHVLIVCNIRRECWNVF